MIGWVRGQFVQDVSELRMEAARARELANSFRDPLTLADLENYASALDATAAVLVKRKPS